METELIIHTGLLGETTVAQPECSEANICKSKATVLHHVPQLITHLLCGGYFCEKFVEHYNLIFAITARTLFCHC